MPTLHVTYAPCLSLHWSGGIATSQCAASDRRCPVAALQGGQSGDAAANMTRSVRLHACADTAEQETELQSRSGARAHLDVIKAVVHAHPHAVLGICIHVALDLHGIAVSRTSSKLH